MLCDGQQLSAFASASPFSRSSARSGGGAFGLAAAGGRGGCEDMVGDDNGEKRGKEERGGREIEGYRESVCVCVCVCVCVYVCTRAWVK